MPYGLLKPSTCTGRSIYCHIHNLYRLRLVHKPYFMCLYVVWNHVLYIVVCQGENRANVRIRQCMYLHTRAPMLRYRTSFCNNIKVFLLIKIMQLTNKLFLDRATFHMIRQQKKVCISNILFFSLERTTLRLFDAWGLNPPRWMGLKMQPTYTIYMRVLKSHFYIYGFQALIGTMSNVKEKLTYSHPW